MTDTERNALEDAATEVLRAACHGDQHFIAALKGDDERTVRLRLAIVRLQEVMRGDDD